MFEKSQTRLNLSTTGKVLPEHLLRKRDGEILEMFAKSRTRLNLSTTGKVLPEHLPREREMVKYQKCLRSLKPD